MEPAFTGSVQVGGCRVELRLDSTGAAWEAPFTGELLLISDGSDYLFSRLEVVLRRMPAGPEGAWESSFNLDAARFNSVSLTAKSERRLPFSLQIGRGLCFSNAGQVKLLAHIQDTGSSEIATSIRVLPPAEFGLIADFVAAESRLTQPEWTSIDDGAGVVFKAVDDSQPIFNSLRLRFYRGRGMVYGQLAIEPFGPARNGLFRAATGRSLNVVEFRLPIGDHEAARSFIQETLRPYMNAVQHLPIPADTPTSTAKELPGPSDAPHRTGRGK